MTVYEMYEQTIKVLPADERLHLAKLILNDLSPDEERFDRSLGVRPGEIQDQDHLEELLLAGLNSPKREMTGQDWADLRQMVRDHAAGKMPDA